MPRRPGSAAQTTMPRHGSSGPGAEMPIPTGAGRPGGPRIGADLGGHVADPCDDRLDPLLIARRHGAPCVNRQVGGDERRADLGAAEVDRQDRPIGELVHVGPDC